MATETAKDRAVTTYDLSEAEREAVRAAAAKDRHSVSRWIADAIRAALKRVRK